MHLDSLSALAPLAFGAPQASVGRSLNELSESTRRVVPSLISYDAPNTEDFCYRSSFTRVNGLALAAIAVPATRLQVGSQSQGAMIFAQSGEFAFEAQKKLYTGQASGSAVFIPPDCPTVMNASRRSSVVIQIDWVRLKNTSSAMLGTGLRESEILLHPAPQQIALTQARVSFDAVFRGLFAQIDLYAGHPEMLQISGIDDTFYRTLAIAMDPQAFIRQAEARKIPVDQRRLARVCDYVIANLSNPITLTELERVGHMSRRTLHNAFMRAFGISPMAWVREQRLLKARALLLARPMTVTEVLYASGVTHASLFATLYAKRFGELPSATLARSGGLV